MPARKTRSSPRFSSRRKRKQPFWAEYDDERLLDMPMRRLQVSLEGTFVEGCIAQVNAELERRDLRFRPHFWISEEWFSPDGIPGVAVPFYLAHPRLMRLERSQMLEVEGGSYSSCLRIIRHEVGHAIDHAYRLHRRRRWQSVFGKSSEPYPEFYQPKPYSKNYVLHLDFWYAQAHPDEDFAETFAVWLRPRKVWRKRYEGWPALRKLEYVDELMREIADSPPPVRDRTRYDPLSRIDKTLREHYEEKRRRYGSDHPHFYDRDLRRLFAVDRKGLKGESAAAFIRRNSREIRHIVSLWTNTYEYSLDQVLNQMVNRCRELKLRAVGPEKQLKTNFAVLLTVQTMNYLHSGRHRLVM